MYTCKHCNKQIITFDDISIHNCFLGKAVFMEENNNVLFYCQEDETCKEDKREYNIKVAENLLSILPHIY